MLKKVAFILMILLMTRGFAGSFNPKISLDLQNVTIQDALHIVAKLMQHNIVISPSVQGMTSVHFSQIPAQDAFNSMLASNGLREWEKNQIWYVGSYAEWMKLQQQKIEWENFAEDTSPLVTRIWQVRYAKAEDILRLIEDAKHSLLSKRGQARIDKRTNTLIVKDHLSRLREIEQLLARIDIQVEQVLIETHLASIDSDYERALGIHFSTTDEGISIFKMANGNALDLKLAALEKSGHGKLISSPSLFTMNQQTASIESGEEIPYQETSGSGATSVTFKKAVLSLKVTPQVMPGNQVMLQLQVNQDKPNKRVVLGVPAISTRQMSTHILVKNGETIVLGGIYESTQEEDQQEIPILSKIPLVGWLFQQQNILNNKRELLIFVTPKVIMSI